MHLLNARAATHRGCGRSDRSRPDAGRHRDPVGGRHRARLPRRGRRRAGPRARRACALPTCSSSAIRSRSTSTSSRSSRTPGSSSSACSAAAATGPMASSRWRRSAAREQHPARGAAGRRPARPGARRLVDAAARGLPSPVAVRRPRRPRQRPADAGLRARACSARPSPGRSRRRCCAPGSTGRASPARRSPICDAAGEPDRALAALVFYRALVQAGDLAAIDALIAALDAAGLNALPIFTASLKDPLAAPVVRQLLAEAPPAVVLNATGFAVSSPGQRRATPLDEPGRTVLQLVLAGGSEAGLARRHARPLAARSRDERSAARDRRPGADARGRVQVPEPLRSAHREPTSWASRRSPTGSASRPSSPPPGRGSPALPAAERRVALVLANYPNRDGRIANGVGLDTPASTVRLLQRARRTPAIGSRACPPTARASSRRCSPASPTQLPRPREAARSGCGLPLPDYLKFFDQLPAEVQKKNQRTMG